MFGFERLAYISEHFSFDGFFDTCDKQSQSIIFLRKPTDLQEAPKEIVASDFAEAAYQRL